MATLTFKQIREYQTQLESKYAELENDGLSFKEMRTIQAQIADIYTLLGEDGTEPATDTALTERLNDTLKNGTFEDIFYFAYDNCQQIPAGTILTDGITKFSTASYSLGELWQKEVGERPSKVDFEWDAKLCFFTLPDGRKAVAQYQKDKQAWRWRWDKKTVSLFDRLLAGEFNNLPMQQYLDKWNEANKDFDNSNFADLENKIATAMSEYMAAHRTEIHNPAGLNITQQDIDEAA